MLQYLTLEKDADLRTVANLLKTLGPARYKNPHLEHLKRNTQANSYMEKIGKKLRFPRFERANRVSSMKVMGWKETTPEIRKTAQILEMSQILGRVFKHADEEDARKTFVDMDANANGVIEMEELMTGLRRAGFSPDELNDLR